MARLSCGPIWHASVRLLHANSSTNGEIEPSTKIEQQSLRWSHETIRYRNIRRARLIDIISNVQSNIFERLRCRKCIGRVEDRRQVLTKKGQKEQESSALESASAPWDARVTRLPRLPRAPRSPGGPAAPAAPRSPRAPSAPSTHRTLTLAPHTTSSSLSLRTIATATPRCIDRPLSEFTFYWF